MVLRLTKTITDATIDAQRERIYVPLTILNGISISDYLLDFNMSLSQSGGSFSAKIARYGDYPRFVENQYVTVFSRGQDTFIGIIENISFSVGSEGKTIEYSGSIVSVGIRNNIKATFESADPFTIDGQIVNSALANNFPVVNFSNYYRYLGLSSSVLLNALSSISGIPVSVVSMPIGYPIYKYVVEQGRVYQAAEEISKMAGANAIVRSVNGIFGIYILGWNDYIRAFNYDFSDCLSGIQGKYEKSEFDAVMVQSSSEMTPYNSTFAGPPEQVTQISFEAGQHKLSDLSNGPASTSTQDSWIYPETPGNQWVEYETDGFATSLMLNFGSPVWDVKYINERQEYSTLINNLLDGSYTDTFVDQGYSYTTTAYKVLLRWDRAVYKLSNNGDMYPYLLVLPGNAPSFVDTFNVNSNLYSVDLVGKTDLPLGITANCPPPAASFGGFNPNYPSGGKVVPVYSNPELTGLPGFAEDGTGYIGIYPKPTSGVYYYVTYNTKWDVQELKNISGTRAVIQGKPSAPVEKSVIKIVDLQTNKAINPTTAATTWDPATDPSNVLSKKTMKVTLLTGTDSEKKTRLKKIVDLMLNGKYDVVVMPYGSYTRSVEIDTFGLSTDKLSLIINLKKPVYETYDGSLIVSTKSETDVERDHSSKEEVSYIPDLITLNDSGFVNQRGNQLLKGSWTLFGFKRKTYPVTCIKSIVQPDQVFVIYNNQPYGLIAKNVKSVSSSLITDCFRSDMTSTHAYRLCDYYATYLSQNFTSFNISVPDYGTDIPQVGDKIVLSGVPDEGTIEGKIVSVSLKVSASGGSVIDIQCGRLELP